MYLALTGPRRCITKKMKADEEVRHHAMPSQLIPLRAMCWTPLPYLPLPLSHERPLSLAHFLWRETEEHRGHALVHLLTLSSSSVTQDVLEGQVWLLCLDCSCAQALESICHFPEHQKPPAASQQRMERWKLTAVIRKQGALSRGGKGETGKETATTEPIETPEWPVRAARLGQAVYSKALKDGVAVIREETERWKRSGGT